MKKNNFFNLLFIISLLLSVSVFGKNEKKSESTSFPIKAKLEVVRGSNLLNDIQIKDNYIKFTDSSLIKKVCVNKKEISKKNNEYLLELDNDSNNILEIDINI